MKKYYLAIDLGASSGRLIVGYKDDENIVLDEVFRFSNEMKNSEKGLVWDLDGIFENILLGIKRAFEKYTKIESLSIDTWGLDYVLLKNGEAIKPFYTYRNLRNRSVFDEVHTIISFDDYYRETGIQIKEFNSIYQLYCDKKEGRLEIADRFLMIPEYFNYLLTGVIKKEYTNATTTGLINANKKLFSEKIISKLGLPSKLFNDKLHQKGEFVGKLKDEIANFVGGQLDVVLCSSHDTASAYESIDFDENSVFVSSGTWSLMGVKAKEPITNEKSQEFNFTNEGGIGYIRYLKNIMGMWIFNSIYKESKKIPFDDIVEGCFKSSYERTFNVNENSLFSPKSMREEVCKLIDDDQNKIDDFDLYKSVFDSVAMAYANTVLELETVLNKKLNKIYIVGGGAKNKYLNYAVEKYSGKEVIALPIEATAIGNLKSQMQ